MSPSCVLACASSLLAPFSPRPQFLINDRTNDTIYRVQDYNLNDAIDEPGEVTIWFNSSNLPGTLGPMNPSCLAVRAIGSSGDGFAIMGDQQNQVIYALHDINRDGDALDAGESIVAASAGNLSGVSFAFPTGAAFDSLGRAYVVNAGNSFGNDGIYRLVDLNADGDYQDTGEITDYVTTGAFGPGNGPYSPQEIVFDSNNVGYVRNSSAGLQGIFRFVDSDSNGRADDPGEFTTFLDTTNASGVAVLAGFALELDAARPRSMYTIQAATGGVDQILRATDLNNDNDAQDAGEVVMVYSTAESGFTAVDVVSLANGDLLVTDNSGNRVIRLHDLDADGLYMSPGERTDYFQNSTAILGAVRQMSSLPVQIPCSGDTDADGIVDQADLPLFESTVLEPELATPVSLVRAADVNCDGATDGLDIDAFVELLLN